MATASKKVKDNVDGDFFVDTTCIDCDTCRWVAPDIFDRRTDQSRVFQQPANDEQRAAAFRALLTCPTASIGCQGDKKMLQPVRASFPYPLDGPVSYCGYAAESSFGAAAWFIETPEGNVMADCPRYSESLALNIEKRGGLKWIWLSHRDDVADHKKWAEKFNAKRVLHKDDVTADTRHVEIQPQGLDVFEMAPGFKVIPVPGHSKGHTCLLYKDKYLFSGDHLAWRPQSKSLTAFTGYVWHSWAEQIKSMERLAGFDFEWVIPGHGRLVNLEAAVMKEEMARVAAWMKTQKAPR